MVKANGMLMSTTGIQPLLASLIKLIVFFPVELQ